MADSPQPAGDSSSEQPSSTGTSRRNSRRSAERRRLPGRSADSILGYLIPLAILGIAIYQVLKTGQVDKYVLGALLIFGLGALGWRLDVIFEGYMRARYPSLAEPTAPAPVPSHFPDPTPALPRRQTNENNIDSTGDEDV